MWPCAQHGVLPSQYNAALDYNLSLFYTASGHDWALDFAKQRIQKYAPCVVHMPFMQAPHVAAGMRALFDETFDGRPWPEGNLTLCRYMNNVCKESGWGLFDLSEV